MTLLTISAFLGVVISSAGITYLVKKELDFKNPKTISQLVARNQSDLRIFQTTIFLGGSLIALAVFFFIAPSTEYSLPIAVSFGVVYLSELLLSLFPDKSSTGIFTFSLHSAFAYSMALGMLITTVLLSFALDGTAARIEAILIIFMLTLSLVGVIHRKGFIFC